jgi:hypothetical protein
MMRRGLWIEACRQWWSCIWVATASTGILCAEAATNAPGPLAAPVLVKDIAMAWPQWRGPLATGVSPTAHPPLQWSETNHVRWKLPLPGKGHSSPIILGDRVVVMTAVPVGEAQKPVFDQAPGVHDSVPVSDNEDDNTARAFGASAFRSHEARPRGVFKRPPL